MAEEPIDSEYEERGQINLLPPGKSYPGQSDRKDLSDWRDLHLAAQRAAKAAAADLQPGEERWYEVSRVQILVGNPNIKIYRVILTPSD